MIKKTISPYKEFEYTQDKIRRIKPLLEVVAKETGLTSLNLTQGNPEGPILKEYADAFAEIVAKEARGELNTNAYCPTNGIPEYLEYVAKRESEYHGIHFRPSQILATPGAARAVSSLLAGVGRRQKHRGKVVLFAPFFPPYLEYIKDAGLTPEIIPYRTEEFQLQALQFLLDEKVRAVIINSPNNPSGAIYSKEFLSTLGEILGSSEAQPLLISDEPYRNLLLPGEKEISSLVSSNYANAVVANSFSKSMRLAGERIGYIAFPDYFPEYDLAIEKLSAHLVGDGTVQTQHRAQKALSMLDPSLSVDWTHLFDLMKFYIKEFQEMGYNIIEPRGGMFMCVKAPLGSGVEFHQHLLQKAVGAVPGEAFGLPGYVRLSICTKDASNREEVLKRFYEVRKQNYS
ncbi:MAG: pyridoxal phosphate-dependent aminotransferase [Candidatus Nanoarchaeia archaeon]